MSDTHRLPERITLRIPAAVAVAIEVAARHELTSPSEIARRALIQVLRAGGHLQAEGGNAFDVEGSA